MNGFIVVYLSILGCVLCLLFAFRRDPDDAAFMDRESAYTMRGLAIILVVLCHFGVIYLQNRGPLDAFVNVLPYSGGVAVGIFFLFSGYAAFVTSGGASTITVIWVFRKLAILYMCFVFRYITELWLLYSSGDPTPGGKDVILDLLFFRSYFGDQLWFLKVQAGAFVAFGLIFKAFKRYGLLVLWIVAIGYCVTLILLDLPDFWWNSFLCFPLGVTAARWKRGVVAALRRANPLVVAIPTLAALVVTYRLRMSGDAIYGIVPALAVCLLLGLAGSRYKIHSPPLEFIGRRSLEIYVWQWLLLKLFIGRESVIENAELGLLACYAALVVTTFVTTAAVRLFTGRPRSAGRRRGAGPPDQGSGLSPTRL